MKKLNLTLLIILINLSLVFGQASVLFRINNPLFYPTGGDGSSGLVTNSTSLNAILTSFNVINYEPAYQYAYVSNPLLNFDQFKGIYKAECNCNAEYLITALKGIGITTIAEYIDPQLTSVPNDYRPATLNTPTGVANTSDPNEIWHLDKIKAQLAWDISTGSSDIKIAIIDEGFDVNHEDLAGKIQFQDQPYYNILLKHGTFTSSLAAGATNNTHGMSSIGYNSSLMLFELGSRFTADIIIGAVLDGANVISMSFGKEHIDPSHPAYPSQYELVYLPEQTAINIAKQKNVFVVAAAGNGMTQSMDPNKLFYPASYDNVFSVTSTWFNDYHSNPSQPATIMTGHHHNEKVDLCAPGYHIWKADINNTYSFGDGTSFSAPLVAGTVALMKAVNPYLTNDQIEEILKRTADDISNIGSNSIYAGKLGAGRLNSFEAVKAAKDGYTLMVPNGQTLTINTPQSHNKIIVKSGGTLYINNTIISMYPNGKIYIEPGGKMFATNSTFKAANPVQGQPSFKWMGVFVEGNKNQGQDPPFYNNQGYLRLLGCIVQDARNAVSTKGDADTWNAMMATGGVIYASNTLFRDNGRHIEFLSYHNIIGGQERNNNSVFSNCRFEVDNGQILNSGNKTMVTAWDVKGVKFEGCDFVNTYMNMAGQTNRGTGILAVDAALIIQDIKPNGFNSQKKGNFTNLQFGIKTSFDGVSDDNIIINNINFNRNYYGTILAGGNGGSVYRNNFSANGQTFYNSTSYINYPNMIGLQTVFASSFKAEQNYTKGLLAREKWAGSDLKYSDRWYNGAPFTYSFYTMNTIEENFYGITAGVENTGLFITCNNLKDNEYAMEILANDYDAAPRKSVPYFSECTVNEPKDYNNSFISNDLQDIYNSNNQIPNHIYVVNNSLPSRPSQSKSLNMAISPCPGTTVDEISCIGSFNPEPGSGPATGSSGTGEKRSELMLKKNALPEAPLEVAYPNGPCQTLSHQNFTDIDIAPFMEVAKLRGEILHTYVNNMLVNDDPTQLNELIDFLISDNNTEARKMLVSIYYNHGNYNLAYNTLQLISSTNCDDYWFVLYYSLLLQVANENRNIFMLSIGEKEQLYNIAASYTAISASAKGVIELVYGEPYEYPLLTEDSVDLTESNGSGSGVVQLNNANIQLMPNPSVENTTLSYSFDSGNNATVLVLDWYGQIKGEWQLDGNSGSIVLPTDNWLGGLYVVQLIINNQLATYKVLQLLK